MQYSLQIILIQFSIDGLESPFVAYVCVHKSNLAINLIFYDVMN